VKLLEVRLIITNMNLPAPLLAFKRSVTALLSLALMLPAGFTPMAYAQGSDSLPSLGDPASADLSPGAERKLGERIMREIRRDPDFLPDPQLTDYLNRLAGRLSENLPRYAESGAPLSVELFGVRDRVVNAFALPGGFIGIHTGLITTARTESELASVIAHEMSHVSQRHIARNIAKQSQTSMVALAAILLGVLAATWSVKLIALVLIYCAKQSFHSLRCSAFLSACKRPIALMTTPAFLTCAATRSHRSA
jgi:predicted Zn-dependent protease